MKRRCAEDSADGLALMTSLVTSSYSADGLREQSQDSTGSLYIQTQERSDVVEEEIQSQATVHQQMLFGDSDSKTMSFILVDTTAFCSCAKDSAGRFCVEDPAVARYQLDNQTQAIAHPVESFFESAVAIYPVASFSAIAFPVDLIPRRKKRRSRRSVETKPVASYSIQSQENKAQRIQS
ncbi:hypothetical protein F511_09981 [Dorcoceras hygrometricum]|uniref:Uncharacterized protein n=1 Tax=Dorcoceras hygrometricum TaxID=472368 RepID=A0A2Z7DA72_9LAMI|nr:hypothetical protein F511_09981 [Dorcoceras hygrometricum]